jgi:hypothetical protein
MEFRRLAMAQAWIKDLREEAGWLAAVLRENCYAIRPGGDAPLLAIPANGSATAVPILRQAQNECWLFLLPPKVSAYVNGQRLTLGMRLLRDRDEILLPEPQSSDQADAEPQRIYFSTERLAVVEAFPGAKKPVSCSRCKQVIEAGQLAVRCPNSRCGLWHHEFAEQPCWTYAEKCSNCDQATALDAGYCWSPEQL